MLKVLIYKRYGYEALYQRIKAHLERETARTGRKLTQRDFVLGLIKQALNEAESSGADGEVSVAPCPALEEPDDTQPQEEGPAALSA